MIFMLLLLLSLQTVNHSNLTSCGRVPRTSIHLSVSIIWE